MGSSFRSLNLFFLFFFRIPSYNPIITNFTIFSINFITIIPHSPGGVDYDYAKELGIQANMYQGIPGKIAPKSSAEILYQYISKHI